MGPMLPVVLNLLIINGLVFIFVNLFPDASLYFLLNKTEWFHPNAAEFRIRLSTFTADGYILAGTDYFRPIQLVTHFFTHFSPLHLIFNMWALAGLGNQVEYMMGSRRFLEFYLFCGIMCGIVTCIFDPSIAPVAGASGAIFGVLVAFARYFPTQQLMIFPIPFGIQARYLIIGLAVFSLLLLYYDRQTNISHFAHLAGMIAGVLYFSLMRLIR